MKNMLLLGVMALSASAVLADPALTSDNPVNTVSEQSPLKSDADISAAIRGIIMQDNRISADAHRILIVTNGGVASLSGKVDSMDERKIVYYDAAKVAGEANVNGHLEVK